MNKLSGIYCKNCSVDIASDKPTYIDSKTEYKFCSVRCIVKYNKKLKKESKGKWLTERVSISNCTICEKGKSNEKTN